MEDRFLLTQDELKRRGPQTRITVFRNRAKTFSPSPNRPPSADMKRFGVTAWLDEALRIRDDLRGEVLAFLKQQMGVKPSPVAGRATARPRHVQTRRTATAGGHVPARDARGGRQDRRAAAVSAAERDDGRHRPDARARLPLRALKVRREGGHVVVEPAAAAPARRVLLGGGRHVEEEGASSPSDSRPGPAGRSDGPSAAGELLLFLPLSRSSRGS